MCRLKNWKKSVSMPPPSIHCATAPATQEGKLEEIAEDLRTLDGIDEDLLRDLAQAGITTRDGLAELSIDELREITGVEPGEAEKIILAARAHWFETDEQ